MIEIDGVEYRTEGQWERVHRHVKPTQIDRGIERTWSIPCGGLGSAVFYARAQTKPWTKKERAAEIRRRREEREAERIEEIKDEARAEGRAAGWAAAMRELTGVPVGKSPVEGEKLTHTAWQWVSLGFVPVEGARWFGTRYDEIGTYYYAHVRDVRWDPDRAAELLLTGPKEYDRLPDGRPYNGLPWW